ncbi:MAG: prephenate dehydratase, partial [Moorella sp. (in: Bacteria)]|nr:prephenate dehydratase [Moorella sp. (in: firmicutes)]
MKIGYLGPPGTFSEMAARRYLEGTQGAEMVSLPSLAGIFLAVEKGELDEGILPLENSTEGSVTQTLDLLAHRFPLVKIKGELVLPVTHQLLVRPGVALKEVQQVLSHPQALAQCRSFLERFLPAAE